MQDHITLLKVKSAEHSGQRWIEGWATTPSVDRQGDIVLPQGAEYSLPLILLFGHDHKQPIGSVEHATTTAAGIRIRARLTPGIEKADEVWTLLQDGAPLAMSIGFQALASEPLPGGGLRYTRWSWHELSVVSVPANPDARLTVGKGMVLDQAKAEPVPGGHVADADMVALYLKAIDHLKAAGVDPNKPITRATLAAHLAVLSSRIDRLERSTT